MRFQKTRMLGATGAAALLILSYAAAVFTAEEDLLEFDDELFDSCILGPGMECSTTADEGAGFSYAEGYCGEGVSAGSQFVNLSVSYYLDELEASDRFESMIPNMENMVSYYESGCSDDFTCRILTLDNSDSEMGYLAYNSKNSSKERTFHDGSYQLLYGSFYAGFTLHGPVDKMDEQDALHYYETAKACLKAIVLEDACRGIKNPIPEEKKVIQVEQPYPAAPVAGSDPEFISPVGLGSLASGGDDLSDVRVHLCAFEDPVDILFDFGTRYVLNGRNRVTSYDQAGQGSDVYWKQNVTEEIDAALPTGFGGLFPDNRVPKGDYEFNLFVIPSGGDFTNSTTPAHVWVYTISVECEDMIPLPEEKQFFFVSPQAYPTTGIDPPRINPFETGTYAVGGKILWMKADFCSFGEWVDVYFGMYCPLTDPLNIYFANGSPNSADELFQKVPVLLFLLNRELPQLPFSDNESFDPNQNSPVTLFAGPTNLDVFDDIPARRSVYILAVTPKGVRDKFYAWIMPLDLDIKDAFEQFWVGDEDNETGRLPKPKL